MRLNDRNLPTFAHETADRLGELCAALDHGALGRMAQARTGVPAARYDRTGGRTDLVADPTASSAIALVEMGQEAAAAHRREIERMVIRARGCLDRALQLVALYPEARTASEADRLALARLNHRAEPGCESCARVEGPAGGPRWEPIDSRLAGPTDVAGRLAEPKALCRWCHDCVSRWGRLPSERELERHHDGKRVGWPADVPPPA